MFCKAKEFIQTENVGLRYNMYCWMTSVVRYCNDTLSRPKTIHSHLTAFCVSLVPCIIGGPNSEWVLIPMMGLFTVKYH